MQAQLSARVWIWGTLLTVLAVIGVVIWIVIAGLWKIGAALSSDTQSFVRLNPAVLIGPPEFDLTYGKDVTDLSVFIVKDSQGNVLWTLSGNNSLTPAKIVYGTLPAGPAGSWKQDFPLDNKAPRDIRGKSIQVEIDCRYNIALGPGHQRNDAEFDIPK